MNIGNKYLVSLFSLALLVTATWYFLLYPEEPWIKYNFAVRADEINALADYLEDQSEFKEFSCFEDDVWLDKKAASPEVHKAIQHHCRTARMVMGEQTELGSSYYLGWKTRWLNEYWIAAIRATEFDAFKPCPRWRKPDPLESCIVRISDAWAIHYFNATGAGDDVRKFGEDLAQDLSTK